VPELYDPTIQTLLSQVEEDWGDPDVNREKLIPYGIKEFDKYLYGIDIINGELILVLGKEKNRKTTFAINVLINYMTDETLQEKPVTVIDTLESGMTPTRYRDQMIANLATRWLISEGHFPKGACSECGADLCRQTNFSPEFLRYHNRTPAQLMAINYAIETMASWPLYLFGANPSQGGTRNLLTSVKGGQTMEDTWHQDWKHLIASVPVLEKESRWDYMIREYGAKIFIADHVQQYSFQTDITDYEKQLRAVSAISDMVSFHQIAAIVLSQVSLTSVRDSRSGHGRQGAMGGSKLAQEANVALSTHYDPDHGGMMSISIEESRKSGGFHVLQRLDDTSGAYYGNSEMRWKRIDLRVAEMKDE